MSDSNAELTSDVKWAQVPEWVICSDISDRAVRLYAMLSRRANDDHRAFPSRRYLAKSIRCSVKSVDRALEELVGIGAVTKERQFRGDRQTVNLYTLRAMMWSPVTRGGDTGDAGGGDTADAQNESHRNESHKNTLAAAPREEAKPKAARPEDPLWNAMLAACGIDGTTITKTGRGQVNAALKELREIGATPADIDAKAKVYRKTWPDASLTPSALVKHWAALATKAEQVKRTCECGQPLDRHSDEVHDILMRGGL